MNTDDLELFRQVWSVPVACKYRPVEQESKGNGEEDKSINVKEGKSRIVLENLDLNSVIASLVEKITETDAGAAEDRNKFDPAQLKKGKLGFAYRDQLGKIYGEVIEVMPHIPLEKAEREFRAIVLVEKSRIRRNGRQIATLLKTRLDIEKEKIKINSWIEQEYAAGKCPVHRWYKMPYKKADPDGEPAAETEDGSEEA